MATDETKSARCTYGGLRFGVKGEPKEQCKARAAYYAFVAGFLGLRRCPKHTLLLARKLRDMSVQLRIIED